MFVWRIIFDYMYIANFCLTTLKFLTIKTEIYWKVVFINSISFQVNWHTVFWGIALQYIFAILILRTQWGFDMFQWLGDRVTEFLEYVMAGVIFAFGGTWADHLFVTKVSRLLWLSALSCQLQHFHRVWYIALGCVFKSELHCILWTILISFFSVQ